MTKPAKNRLFRKWQAFLQDQSGVTTIEYGLIAMLILTIVVVFVGDLSNQKLWNVFTQIASSLDSMRQAQQ